MDAFHRFWERFEFLFITVAFVLVMLLAPLAISASSWIQLTLGVVAVIGWLYWFFLFVTSIIKGKIS